jgi:flagellar motor switch protein FliN/FliY
MMADETATATQTMEAPPAQAAPPLAAPEPAQGVPVQPAELSAAEEKSVKVPAGQIDLLLDTSMSITACLGQVEVRIRELLQMGPESVVKLDKKVGEPVELFLRGVRFAQGSLVVVGDQLGVRITDIVSPSKKDKGEA